MDGARTDLCACRAPRNEQRINAARCEFWPAACTRSLWHRRACLARNSAERAVLCAAAYPVFTPPASRAPDLACRAAVSPSALVRARSSSGGLQCIVIIWCVICCSPKTGYHGAPAPADQTPLRLGKRRRFPGPDQAATKSHCAPLAVLRQADATTCCSSRVSLTSSLTRSAALLAKVDNGGVLLALQLVQDHMRRTKALAHRLGASSGPHACAEDCMPEAATCHAHPLAHGCNGQQAAICQARRTRALLQNVP